MSKVERIENEIESLSPEELARLREWFLEFDWRVWDDKLERDIHAGHFDVLADEALHDQESGQTSPI